MKNNLNLFLTALTSAAPSSNFRGQTEGNAVILQKISYQGKIHSIVSAESLRSAWRERLEAMGAPMNRSREPKATAPTVNYASLPAPADYLDDFFFGWMTTSSAEENAETEPANEMTAVNGGEPVDKIDDSLEDLKTEEPKTELKTGKKAKAPKVKLPKGSSNKHESFIRVNLGVSTSEFNYESLFHQSPGVEKGPQKSKSAGIFTNEIHYTAYQYPLAINLSGAHQKAIELGIEDKFFVWLENLLTAIFDVGQVAGNQTRSWYDFSPVKIFGRLTSRLSPGFPLYCFDESGNLTSEAKEKCQSVIDSGESFHNVEIGTCQGGLEASCFVPLLMRKIKEVLQNVK